MYMATGRCIRDKLRVIHQGGFGTVTDAQLALFHNIDIQGTRLTTIAARSGLTKQSMIELVNKCEKNDFVRRSPDPCDKRAKIVTLTKGGFRLVEMLNEGIAFSESEIEKVSGSSFLEEMRHELSLYVVKSKPTGNNDFTANTDRTHLVVRGDGTGRILSVAARHFALCTLQHAHQNGYENVKEASLALFRNLDVDGSRLTEIAARARMTKQSMRELVERAATQGYVSRERDAGDARAKVITFTPVGLAMLEQMRHGVTEAEKDLKRKTQSGFIERLKPTLAEYVRR